VRAALNNTPVIEHENLIRVHDVESRCAMTMDVRFVIKRSSASESALGRRVHARSSFVENQDGGSLSSARQWKSCFSPTLNFTLRSPTTLSIRPVNAGINCCAFAATTRAIIPRQSPAVFHEEIFANRSLNRKLSCVTNRSLAQTHADHIANRFAIDADLARW